MAASSRASQRRLSRRCYQPYGHATQLSDVVIRSPYASTAYCMGAKSSAKSSTLALAAMVDANTFDNPTSLHNPRGVLAHDRQYVH